MSQRSRSDAYLSMDGRRGAVGSVGFGVSGYCYLGEVVKQLRLSGPWRVLGAGFCAVMGGYIQAHASIYPLMLQVMKQVRSSLPVLSPSAGCEWTAASEPGSRAGGPHHTR